MKHFENVLDMPARKYKHVFFDMDNTVTPSRSAVEDDMREILVKLGEQADVAIVSGGSEAQIWRQMTDYFKDKISFMAQNGNNAFSHEVGKYLWKRTLSSEEKKEILDHIGKIKSRYGGLIASFQKETDEKLIEDRGCQISFSFVGHNAPLADKVKFDPKGETRLNILKEIPLVSETVQVKLGGTTCFDYNQFGKNKGYNIVEWLKYFGWKPEDVLYVGDALFPGGNDDTVLGVCDTLQVSGPAETFTAIEKIIR